MSIEEEKEQKTQNTGNIFEEKTESVITLVNEEKIKSTMLTLIEKSAIKELIKKNIEEGVLLNKDRFYDILVKSIPYLTKNQYTRLYREAETEYFQAINRIPREIMINKLTAEADALKDKVLDESNEDITKQVAAITRLNDQVIRINRLEDTPPVVQINFSTDVDINKLINPDIIDITEEKSPAENKNTDENNNNNR